MSYLVSSIPRQCAHIDLCSAAVVPELTQGDNAIRSHPDSEQGCIDAACCSEDVQPGHGGTYYRSQSIDRHTCHHHSSEGVPIVALFMDVL